MRKKYMSRFIFRVLVLISIIILYLQESEMFAALEPGQFLKKLTPLHALWAVWLGDMVMKLCPPKGTLALGTTKQCKSQYVPTNRPQAKAKLKQYINQSTKKVLPIFLIWTVLGIVTTLLKRSNLVGSAELFLVSVFFYVCDLICVLFWCPFRVFFMHNRCCTTCRIFNWDHIMMTTPLISIGSLFSWTLIGGSLLIFLIWEFRVYRYPERFFEGTNAALQCRNCTDHLCGRKERYACSARAEIRKAS